MAPPHALREPKTTSLRPSRAARLRALTAAATPSVPTPRPHRSTHSFLDTLEIDRPRSSARAQGLASLVRSLRVFVAPQLDPCPTHFGDICPDFCVGPVLPTGALTERHLAVLMGGRLPYLTRVHVVLDSLDSFSSGVMDRLNRAVVSMLSVHVLKRAIASLSVSSSFNLNNAIGSHSPRGDLTEEADPYKAFFQLICALAPNLDTLVLDGELPRDPPSSAPVSLLPNTDFSLRPSLAENGMTIVSDPAPDCALRALVWRGKLPPSPALLAWLLSAKPQSQNQPRLESRRNPRLEILEMSHLPAPEAFADLLKEHASTLRSLQLHYFEVAHVDAVARSLASRPYLSELVLNKKCMAAPILLHSVRAQHVSIAQPCAQIACVLEEKGIAFRHVTVVNGEKSVNDRVRKVCEEGGVTFNSLIKCGVSRDWRDC